jgi:hypothetical protein
MHNAHHDPARLADADPARWPIQIRQTPYGWTVTCYSADGHIRHVTTSPSEMQAYRAAYNMAHSYHVETQILVNTDKGELRIDLDKLLKARPHSG